MSKFCLKLFFIFCSLYSFQVNAQKKISIDKVQIDTLKWTATDSLFAKINNDDLDDLILVYDKYRGLVRPNGVQTPIIIFFGIAKNKFRFFLRTDKIICVPDFKISLLKNGFEVLQKGIKNDRNSYHTYFQFKGKEIVAFREIVSQSVVKLKTDNETGELIETRVNNVIFDRSISISIDNYNCLKMMIKN